MRRTKKRKPVEQIHVLKGMPQFRRNTVKVILVRSCDTCPKFLKCEPSSQLTVSQSYQLRTEESRRFREKSFPGSVGSIGCNAHHIRDSHRICCRIADTHDYDNESSDDVIS